MLNKLRRTAANRLVCLLHTVLILASMTPTPHRHILSPIQTAQDLLIQT